MGKTNRRQSGEGVLVGIASGALLTLAFVASATLLPYRIEATPPPVHVELSVARAEQAPEEAKMPSEEAWEPEVMPDPTDNATPAVEAKIRHYAKQYGVPYGDMYRVVACETGNTFDEKIQSYVPDPDGPNGREDSWGLAQIHLPAHPNVTREQAQDADFALDFMARHFAEDDHWMWTCWSL